MTLLANEETKTGRYYRVALENIDDETLSDTAPMEEDDSATEPEEEPEEPSVESRPRKLPAQNIELGDNWKLRNVKSTKGNGSDTEPESEAGSHHDGGDDSDATVDDDDATEAGSEEDVKPDVTDSLEVSMFTPMRRTFSYH